MNSFLKVLVGFFAILFIGTTVLAFALYNVERSAFDADLYIRAFNDEDIYQRLPELTAQALSAASQRADAGTMLSIFRNLSEDEWRQFVLELFPPEVLRTMAEDAVRQVMRYLNGESEKAVLSLASLKTHLNSPAGLDAVFSMLKSQPDCTAEQLAAMALGQENIVLCNPPETFLFVDLRPIYEGEIKAAVSTMPEQVTLISAGPDRAQQLQNLETARTIVRLSPILPMLCLLMVTVLAIRSFWDWLNWWGYPFLLAGLISMFLSALSGPIAAGVFQLFISPVLPGALPQEIANVFRDLTAAIVRNAVQPTLLMGGIMALVGLVMVALAFLLRKRLQKSPQYVR